MTFEIASVLFILAVSLVLFVTEKLRMDVVALLVMSALGVSGLVTLSEALAGFSNPAVITVWSMFILSAGLSATGVADIIGKQVTRMAGRSEPRMIIAIMLTTGILSAFMNNIGVAALMLPVVMDIARRAQVSPSRLLMPMAYASLLGGLTTLVGTPPNLVASDALRQAGHEGFGFFTFMPIGLPALVTGTLFVAFIGRHLLPAKMPESFQQSRQDASGEWQFSHDLEERQFRLQVADGSPFDGRPIRDTGLGAMLGLTVLEVEREGGSPIQVDGDLILQAGDILKVQGRREEYEEFLHWQAFEMAHGAEIAEVLSPRRLTLVSAKIADSSEITGLTVAEADFRHRFQAHILTLKRGDKVMRTRLAETRLATGDVLCLELLRRELPGIEESSDFSEVSVISEEQFGQIYPDTETLLELNVPTNSHLAGATVAESGIWEALTLRIIAIGRKPEPIFFPESDQKILPGDKLLVHGTRDSVERLKGIQSLHLVEGDAGFNNGSNTSADSAFTEATLSPQSSLAGQSLRDLNFRRRFGLQVISIWRKGRAHRSHLRNFRLEFGDALLLAGPREHIVALSDNSDFLVLSHAAYEDHGAKKTPVKATIASLIMGAVVFSVLLGWLPIAIAAVAGATLMIIVRCLDIETAHKAIEWKSVFLIACMIPLGTAMKETGAAEWMAKGVVTTAGPFGPWGIIIGLYLMTALATTIVPTAALVVIMAHIGMDAGAAFGLEPEMVVMAIAMAASASFTSPISHPANVLVMGPGGYRFVDYVRMGLLLALVVMATVIPMIAWLY